MAKKEEEMIEILGTKTLEEMRAKQAAYLEGKRNRKEPAKTEAQMKREEERKDRQKKYFAYVNQKPLEKSVAELVNKIGKNNYGLNRPQRNNEPLDISIQDAKRLYWDILSTIVKQYAQNENAVFEITPSRKEFLNNLVLYLIRHSSSKWDVKKGLLIVGLPGRGKSILMLAASKFYKALAERGLSCQTFEMTNCIKLSYEIAKEKNLKLLEAYGSGKHALDDLGAEPEIPHYGRDISVFVLILTNIYENYIKTGLRPFATTNLLLSEISNKYGLRIESRAIEMYNVKYLDGDIDYRDR